ncbi:MAG: hypothetical protein AAF936_10465 [Pseudomonadota bacterium]
MTFTTSVAISELGSGAGYALWGFRAAATGHADCPTLVDGFKNVFGDYGCPALGGLQLLARELGMSGGRKIKVACPGCYYTTADELSILALLSAAQVQDESRCRAHVAWLMCGKGEDGGLSAAAGVGCVFNSAGMQIAAPQVEIAFASRKTITSLHEAGRA